jgi:hypothetical protein
MKLLTRRQILQGLMGLPILSFWPLGVTESKAQPPIGSREEKRTSIGEFFRGEQLEYEMGFWLSKRAALGKLTFKQHETQGRYVATLQTETLGILGWVARYRVDVYRSTMEEIDGGKRLRSLTFDEEVIIGERLRRRTHTFDHAKRKWIVQRMRKDGTFSRTVRNIPEGKIYDDFVTAAYNFRYGVYGSIERGKTYIVSTFPKKGPSSYEIRVASVEEEQQRRKSEKLKEGKDLYVKLQLDPDLTHSPEGIVEGWLSEDLYPIEGAIKDVMLVGDLTGRLVNRTKI